MDMPNEMKSLGALLAVQKIIETFAELTEAAKEATPEIQAFVKVYEDKVIKSAEALEAVFGANFMK